MWPCVSLVDGFEEQTGMREAFFFMNRKDYLCLQVLYSAVGPRMRLLWGIINNDCMITTAMQIKQLLL